ncbi:hypothetical protein ACIRJO_37975 [Streptomyces sp. NPDC102394]|uniref:hypothetical protein n=1 Tax=Streptomyces sp. NPDC102394 TaxID=3366167 RepID=UPI00382FE379
MSPTRRRRRRAADAGAENGFPERTSRSVRIGRDNNGVAITGDHTKIHHSQPASWAVVITAFVMALAVAATILWVTLEHGFSSSPASDPSRPAASSGSLSPSDDVQSDATWCLSGNSCPVRGGDYYWSGSATQLNSALTRVSRLDSLPGLSAVGSDQIVITFQSASNESVLLTGLRVVSRQHSPNPQGGLIAVPSCGSCGGQTSVYYFITSLDDPAPSALPQDPKTGKAIPGRTGFPLTLSQTDVDVLLLTVNDAHCACSFDLDATWTIKGKKGHTLLTNGGAHFRIMGSQGLPRYHEILSRETHSGSVNNSAHSVMIHG